MGNPVTPADRHHGGMGWGDRAIRDRLREIAESLVVGRRWRDAPARANQLADSDQPLLVYGIGTGALGSELYELDRGGVFAHDGFPKRLHTGALHDGLATTLPFAMKPVFRGRPHSLQTDATLASNFSLEIWD